jgi:hypothetical protein
MRSTSGFESGWKFSLASLAAVAVVVACSPNNGKKTAITPRSAGVFQQKVSSCTDRLRASEKLKLGAKNKVVLCEIPEGQAQAVPVSYPVSFSIQKEESGRKSSSDDVRLAMTVGFETSDTMTQEAREQWRLIFANVCGHATSEIFSRSRLNGFKLRMNLSFTFGDANGDVFGDGVSGDSVSDETVGEPDQILHVKKGEPSGDEFWVFDRLPSRPAFYPMGKKADAVACKAKFPGSDLESVKSFKECARQERALVNAPVCAAFAKRVGNLLGIVDAEKEAAICGAVQPVSASLAQDTQAIDEAGAETAKQDVELASAAAVADKVVTKVDKTAVAVASAADNTAVTAAAGKPRPTNPGESSSFAKPRLSDADFMTKAELNRQDLLTILSPVCPNQL